MKFALRYFTPRERSPHARARMSLCTQRAATLFSHLIYLAAHSEVSSEVSVRRAPHHLRRRVAAACHLQLRLRSPRPPRAVPRRRRVAAACHLPLLPQSPRTCPHEARARPRSPRLPLVRMRPARARVRRDCRSTVSALVPAARPPNASILPAWVRVRP